MYYDKNNDFKNKPISWTIVHCKVTLVVFKSAVKLNTTGLYDLFKDILVAGV